MNGFLLFWLGWGPWVSAGGECTGFCVGGIDGVVGNGRTAVRPYGVLGGREWRGGMRGGLRGRN